MSYVPPITLREKVQDSFNLAKVKICFAFNINLTERSMSYAEFTSEDHDTLWLAVHKKPPLPEHIHLKVELKTGG
jgi:hypothetical protein